MFLFITLLFAGCDEDAPVVGFYYEDLGGGEFYFENITYWYDFKEHPHDTYWYIDNKLVYKTIYDFENDDYSFEYTFPTPGTYKVKLKIYDYNKRKYYKEVRNIEVSSYSWQY